MPLLNALTKLIIQPSEGTPLSCKYNPTDLTIKTGASWRQPPTAGSETAPPSQFVGTQARTISMKLLFDDSWLGIGSIMSLLGGSIQDQVNKVLDWTNPTATSRLPGGTPNPPTLTIFWGGHTRLAFSVFLQSATATYTEFNFTGEPSRATVQCEFSEVPGVVNRQNPTSGSMPGRRTHLMTAGDSLHSIAQREYGKPALWRGLAAANGIDDPMRVPIGTSVLIPPREDAELLS
jgi:nucleoid-associated protein YgaU